MPTPIDGAPGHGPRLVRGHRPAPRVEVISTTNGSRIRCTVGIAAGLIVHGQAELTGEPDAPTRVALDAAIATYRSIPAVRRLEE